MLCMLPCHLLFLHLAVSVTLGPNCNFGSKLIICQKATLCGLHAWDARSNIGGLGHVLRITADTGSRRMCGPGQLL